MAGVLAKMVPMLIREDWNPGASAEAITAHVHGEATPLRETRVHLLASATNRTTLIDLRALATLNLAIGNLESVAVRSPLR